MTQPGFYTTRISLLLLYATLRHGLNGWKQVAQATAEALVNITHSSQRRIANDAKFVKCLMDTNLSPGQCQQRYESLVAEYADALKELGEGVSVTEKLAAIIRKKYIEELERQAQENRDEFKRLVSDLDSINNSQFEVSQLKRKITEIVDRQTKRKLIHEVFPDTISQPSVSDTAIEPIKPSQNEHPTNSTEPHNLDAMDIDEPEVQPTLAESVSVEDQSDVDREDTSPSSPAAHSPPPPPVESASDRSSTSSPSNNPEDMKNLQEDLEESISVDNPSVKSESEPEDEECYGSANSTHDGTPAMQPDTPASSDSGPVNQSIQDETSPTDVSDSNARIIEETPVSLVEETPILAEESQSGAGSPAHESDVKPEPTSPSFLEETPSETADFTMDAKPPGQTEGIESADEADIPEDGDYATEQRGDKKLKNWKKLIFMIWQDIANHRSASLFTIPIKAQDAPGYYDIIKRPIDLKTIRLRIRDDKITTTDEFHRDILLMLQNALMYNSEDSEVYQMTLEMLYAAEDIIGNFKTSEAFSSRPTLPSH
ncbi:hypothetical protein H4R33_005109 [Dimargaris cristalligena]|nr:hypothetical protein H4R33_005109 [Dimargaris cristalligena]